MYKIYGASDDLIEIEGKHGDEIDTYKGPRWITFGNEVIGGIRVFAGHTGEWGWLLSVQPLDDDIPCPWPVSVVVADNGYSMAICIDCPDDTPWAYQGGPVKCGSCGHVKEGDDE